MQTRYQRCQHGWLRGLVGFAVLVTCLRVWVGPFALTESVVAQIPDSGAQRKLLLEETRRTNELLTQIKQRLEQGPLNVRIVGADNQADAPAVRPVSRP